MDSLPPWDLVRDLSRTLILPSAGVSAVVLILALLSGGARMAAPRGQLVVGAVALIAGLVAGNFFRGLLPWWTLERGWPALFPATVAVLLTTISVDFWRSHLRPGREIFLHSLLFIASAYWLAPGDSPRSHLGYFVLLLAAALANTQAVHSAVRPFAASLLLALVVIWGGSAATVLVSAQSARFSEMAVLLSASLFPIGLATLRGKLNAPQLMIVPSIFLPALILNGQVSTYSQVPLLSFLLIAFAPCGLMALRWPAVATWPVLARAVALPGALLAPCALGVLLALRAEPLDFSGH